MIAKDLITKDTKDHKETIWAGFPSCYFVSFVVLRFKHYSNVQRVVLSTKCFSHNPKAA
jgi:hypothetical protein